MASRPRTAARASAAIAAACVLAGCSPTGSRAGVATPPALLYKNDTTPLTVIRGRADERPRPILIPPEARAGKSTSYSFALNIPGIPGGSALSIGWGDMSIEKAMENGGLKEVVYADAREMQILRIFTRTTIIAYGPAENPPPATDSTVAEQQTGE